MQSAPIQVNPTMKTTMLAGRVPSPGVSPSIHSSTNPLIHSPAPSISQSNPVKPPGDNKPPPCRSNPNPTSFLSFPQWQAELRLGSAVADCCRSCCRFVATLVIAAQRCSRCCRFSSVYTLLPSSSFSSSSSIPAPTRHPQTPSVIPSPTYPYPARSPIALSPHSTHF